MIAPALMPQLLPVSQAPSYSASLRLAPFMRLAWPIIEGSRPFHWNWHNDAVCEHLEAVTTGQLRRLIITLPPQRTKSRTVAAYWPAWTWLNDPDHRWLFIS